MLSMQTSENCPCSFQGYHVRLYVAWRTLLVYTSVTPCLLPDSRSRQGTVFVPKHGKKTCQRRGTVQTQIINVGHFFENLSNPTWKKEQTGNELQKTLQIKHNTDRSIGSVSFEPRQKSGKLKYSSTVLRVYSKDKLEIHTRYGMNLFDCHAI